MSNFPRFDDFRRSFEAIQSRLYNLERRVVTKPVGEVFWDAASGDANPTSTTNVSVPGLSISVDSPGTSASWLVVLVADVRIEAADTTNIVELLVDGSPPSPNPQLITGAATAGVAVRATGAQQFLITGLSTGSHTFTARTRNTTGSTDALVRADNTTMTVKRVL